MSTTSTPRPPLEGIRVLDFSRIIAGPLATQQLADLGADVIKIEHPVSGDDARRHRGHGDDRGYFFTTFNRSKRSVAIDIHAPESRELVLGLIGACDVLIENFRPGVMARAGLGYADLAERFPGLIYASISAYGQDGPMADRPGMDPVLQAESGMMALTGEPDGMPMRTPLSMIDMMTACHAATAVLAALYARREDGHGRYLDLSLLDTATAATANAASQYLNTGNLPARTGNAHMSAVPTQLFDTATTPIYLALSTDRLFGRLCREVLNEPDWPLDPRFASAAARLEHRDELTALIAARLVQRPAEYWLEKMRGLPAGRLRRLDEALASEEVAHRTLIRTLVEPDGSETRVLASPLGFAGDQLAPMRPPPHLGEHTAEVLGELLHLGAAEIARLRERGSIR